MGISSFVVGISTLVSSIGRQPERNTPSHPRQLTLSVGPPLVCRGERGGERDRRGAGEKGSACEVREYVCRMRACAHACMRESVDGSMRESACCPRALTKGNENAVTCSTERIA